MRSRKLPPPAPLADDFYAFYERGTEIDRLGKGIGPLERARTQELIRRFLPPAPAEVYDVGGGPGAHSLFMARLGYQVHLLDIMPIHVEQALAASAAQPDHPLVSAEQGDARRLPWSNECADAVLVHGPLYHLTERDDRLDALREAWRVLRPGGTLLAVGITAYASTLAGIQLGLVAEAPYRAMCRREMADGQHLRPPGEERFLATAFFHHPGELQDEAEEAGFEQCDTYAVHGAGWILGDYATFEERWQDDAVREGLLEMVRHMERDPIALGMSPHHIVVGRKPD